MVALYELTDKYRTLFIGNVDPDTGEILEPTSDELKKRLDGIEADFDTKIINIGKLIKEWEGDISVISAEIARLHKNKTTLLNRIDGLKAYALMNMIALEKEEIKTPLMSAHVRTNPPSIEVLNEYNIPEMYRTPVPATWTPNKKAMIDEYKAWVKSIHEDESTEDAIFNIPGVAIHADKKRVEFK